MGEDAGWAWGLEERGRIAGPTHGSWDLGAERLDALGPLNASYRQLLPSIRGTSQRGAKTR